VKFNNNLKLSGFTLAEVLITLGIIGVVAAMTIPTLVASAQKQQYVAQLKKNYSVLSQVLLQISADNDCYGDLACTNLFKSIDNIGLEIPKYVKVLKMSTPSQSADFFASSYKTFEGVAETNGDHSLPIVSFSEMSGTGAGSGYRYLLTDGTAISLNNIANCTSAADSICGTIQIDLNGAKAPNMAGRDAFAFAIMGNATLYPAGGHKFGDDLSWKGTTEYNCTNPLQVDGTACAHGCAGRIIDEGWQMNY